MQGIEMILDLSRALHQGLGSKRTQILAPPITEGDDRLAEQLAGWADLCFSIITEAKLVEPAWDRIMALLGLPLDTEPMKVAKAVESMLVRLQDLENKIARGELVAK